MRIRGLLLAIFAGAIVAAWQQEKPAMDDDTMFYFFDLFSQIVDEAPLANQDEMKDALLDLFARTAENVPPSWLIGTRQGNVEGRTRIAYAAARKALGAVEVEWKDGKIRPTEPVRLDAAAGVERFVLIEIKNSDEATMPFQVTLAGSRARQARVIPSGQTRAYLLSFQATGSGAQSVDMVVATGSASHRIPVELRVAKPAVLRGRIGDPGRLYVESSDGVFRHGKAFRGIPTISEKGILPLGNRKYRLPFFYSDGAFEVAVPPGRTVVTLERGFENGVEKTTLDLSPGEVRDIRMASSRMVDMKSLGWISGDTHVHWTTNAWAMNESMDLLRVVQKAEDVRVVNNLTLRHFNQQQGSFISPTQYPMGPVDRYSDRDYHVQMAEEYRSNFYGHLNFLNIRKLVQPISTGEMFGPRGLDYPTNRSRILEARAQGGLVIEAHGLAMAAPADVAAGVADSVDHLEPEDYYQLLDAGYRISLTNGSDHPARIVGCARAYVKVDGEFSYERWIEGIRKGRTFVTSGPLLFLEVNGAGIGGELKLSKGDRIHVKARAVSRHPIGRLQIVMNHKVVKEVETSTSEASVELEVAAGEPFWVAARCSPRDKWNAIVAPDIAHTSAIYGLVDGQSIFRPAAANYFIRKLKAQSEKVSKEARFADDGQRTEAVQVFQEGIAALEKKR